MMMLRVLTLGSFLPLLFASHTALASTLDRFNLAEAFPEGFLYGTAVSGFQVDMGCPTIPAGECNDTSSDWYDFVTSPWTKSNASLYIQGDSPSKGPGFYELYKDDLHRAKAELSSNAIRVSLEWSRLFPTPTFGVEGYEELRKLAAPEALSYYHRLLTAIRAEGLEPFVTVNHYTLPTWIHDSVGCNIDFAHCDRKGWADPQTIVPEITKYAGFVAHEFGRDVDYWATLNGPFTSVILSGYLLPSQVRTNPPAVYFQVEAAKTAMVAMVQAHARMYDAIKKEDVWSNHPGQKAATVGLIGALLAIEPATQDAKDIEAADHERYLFNDMFFNAVARGDLDVDWDGHSVHHPELADRMDYLGINYYTLIKAANAAIPVLNFISPLFTFDPAGASDSFAPQSLYSVIAETAQYGLPIYVTETGIDAGPDPVQASNWLLRSADATRRAIKDGFDVRGYFYWSLIDNYEWNRGTSLHFGLYEVNSTDPKKTRTARSAAQIFEQLGAAKKLPRVEL